MEDHVQVSTAGVVCGLASSVLLSGALLTAEKVVRLSHSFAVLNLLFALSHAVFSLFVALCVFQTHVLLIYRSCQELFPSLLSLAALQGLRCVVFGVFLWWHGAVPVVYLATCSTALYVSESSASPRCSLALVAAMLAMAFWRNRVLVDNTT
ncbi:hypothetical protein DQ04_01021170 [Trypanosoma grayi]|uniref:hypothetical protein n=1 Tax=Trypanosoma grayi TaxID=71804 RepID=UPI0004F43A90|nr:hypothetical protein DQ04_01021170 [Trypanosoma grayi]KEG13416.1 hypothetical protein DQ04_01021170 [Trypanosoma grayi]